MVLPSPEFKNTFKYFSITLGFILFFGFTNIMLFWSFEFNYSDKIARGGKPYEIEVQEYYCHYNRYLLNESIDAMKWLRNNTAEESLLFSTCKDL